MLSGHGCFRKYLHRFKHDDSSECPSCPRVAEDTEHVFFICPRFNPQRNELEKIINQRVQPKNSLVLLDYSKAFDSVHHEMLLAKMHYYGFHEKVIEWVRSYLTHRKQATRLGSETSVQLVKHRGVPQGSCLGPILYNLYTADFVGKLQNCTAHLYADDSQLHIAYDRSHMELAFYQLNSDLERINRWSVANGLKLNVSKCTVLHTAPQPLVQTLSEHGVRVMLDGQALSVCDKVKTLGFVLDSGLTFTDHVTYNIQRAVGRLRGLYRLRNMIPENAKLQLMQTLILSVFYYCYPAYGNGISGGDRDRIQMLQNSAVRFVFNLRRFDHVSAYRDALNMLPMEAMCEVLTGCMIHKVLSLKEPQYLCERLTHREEVTQRAAVVRECSISQESKESWGEKASPILAPRCTTASLSQSKNVFH